MKKLLFFLIILFFSFGSFFAFTPKQSLAQQIPPCPPTGKTGSCMAPSQCTSGNSFATQACSVDGSRVCCITGDSSGSDSNYFWGSWGKPAGGTSLTNFSNLLGSNAPKNASKATWQNVISTTISLLFLASIILALAYLILGGYGWITSRGDKQKLAQARERIIVSIIGLIIVFLSILIIQVLGQFFKINFLNLP